MSVRWVNAAYNTTVGESTTRQAKGGALSGCMPRKLVLVALADFADEDGFCWPRVKTLMKMTELSESAVRKAVSTLEDDGFLEVREDYEPAGRQTSNVYRLLLLNEKSPPVSRTGGASTSDRGEGLPRTPSTRTTRRNHQEKEEPTDSTRKRGLSEPDDPTAERDPDSPVMGKGDYQGAGHREPDSGSRKPKSKKSKQSADELSAEKIAKYLRVAGTPSAFGQAAQLWKEFREHPAPDAVNVQALARHISQWVREDDGVTLKLVEQMIAVFVKAPQRYGVTDASLPWRVFVNARAKLAVDAGKMVKAKTPTKRVSRYAHLEQ